MLQDVCASTSTNSGHSVGNMELPLFDGSLRETLDLLGVDNLLRLLTSILLEHQILLYSEGKSYSKGRCTHIKDSDLQLECFVYNLNIPQLQHSNNKWRCVK